MTRATDEELKKKWADRLKALVGRKIVSVHYMSHPEQQNLAWDRSAIVLQLDDGALLYPSQDDEGNGPGALFIQKGKLTQSLPDGGAPVI